LKETSGKLKSQQSFRITGTEREAPKAAVVCENSGVRPHQGNAHEEIQSQAAMTPSDILLEPPDVRVGGSSVVPLAGMPVLGTEPSDKLCLVSIHWWRASQNKTANTYIIDIPR
jgi:hypothetical protein